MNFDFIKVIQWYSNFIRTLIYEKKKYNNEISKLKYRNRNEGKEIIIKQLEILIFILEKWQKSGADSNRTRYTNIYEILCR